MKPQLTLALAILLVVANSVIAQEIRFAVSPPNPTTADQVQVTIAQMFPTPCYSSRASFTIDGNVVNVIVVSEPIDVICIQVLAEQEVTVDLGSLCADTYTVNVQWRGAPSWGSATGQSSFTVTEDPPDAIPFVPFKAIGLRFQSELGVRYQIQSSLDMEVWIDFGDVIVGTGDQVEVFESTETAPKKFYRVVRGSG